MDARFLGYYERELNSFGTWRENLPGVPQVASHLALDTADVSDPYVERLLEGFSFLTARLHLRMDAQYPRFLQASCNSCTRLIWRPALQPLSSSLNWMRLGVLTAVSILSVVHASCVEGVVE